MQAENKWLKIDENFHQDDVIFDTFLLVLYGIKCYNVQKFWIFMERP